MASVARLDELLRHSPSRSKRTENMFDAECGMSLIAGCILCHVTDHLPGLGLVPQDGCHMAYAELHMALALGTAV